MACVRYVNHNENFLATHSHPSLPLQCEVCIFHDLNKSVKDRVAGTKGGASKLYIASTIKTDESWIFTVLGHKGCAVHQRVRTKKLRKWSKLT